MLDVRNIKLLQRVVSRKIRDFLFSNKFREILFFLFFVFIASVFWLLNTLNYEHESDVDVLVDIVNVPENIVLVSDNPVHIKVKIKDKGIKLLNYMFRRDGNRITVDMSGKQSASGYLSLKTDNLIRNSSLFPQEASLISCSPDSVKIYYAGAAALKLPVVLDSDVEADRFHFIKDVSVSPDSVMVYVPDNMRDKYKCVKTEKIGGCELSDSASFTVGFENSSKIKVIPDKVKVRYDVGIYTDYSVEVPVTGINFPDGYKLRTFPSTVKVLFQIGLDEIKDIDAGDFSVVLDYNVLKNLDTDEAVAEVVSSPFNVRYVRLDPEKVEFLIERQLW